MAASPSIDPAEFLTEQLSQASPDLLRELLTTFVNALLGAQADAVCGAGYGERPPERVNSRNGYRHRDLDTRIGALDVAVPKLRTGSLYPEWLLERRKRPRPPRRALPHRLRRRRVDRRLPASAPPRLIRSRDASDGGGIVPCHPMSSGRYSKQTRCGASPQTGA